MNLLPCLPARLLQYADRLKRQMTACGRALFAMAPAPADWMMAAAEDIAGAGQPTPSA